MCGLLACAVGLDSILSAQTHLCNKKRPMPPGTHDCGGAAMRCEDYLSPELCPNEPSCLSRTGRYASNTRSWQCEDGQPDEWCGPASFKAVCWVERSCQWEPNYNICLPANDCRQLLDYPMFEEWCELPR